jgi:hypothetical protein
MPLNDKKIISIILKECGALNERCPGYREEIVEVIAEILRCERSHRVSLTNIQQKIADKCNAAADFLATQSRGGMDGGARS